MTNLPPDNPDNPTPLDYQKPPAQKPSTAAFAITLAAICTLILTCSLCSAYPFIGP